jgi:RNA polymerase sigma factor (TIGR02999 family)
MDTTEVTELLKAHSSGDPDAMNRLMPLVYEALRQMAHYRLLDERSGHTLNTTALVHEAYLKLIRIYRIVWLNRADFLGIASKVMRNILVDFAMSQKAQKRGGNQQRLTLDDVENAIDVDLNEILSIHQALERLAALDERQARVVEYRFFGGLTIDETAEVLNISTPSVSRDWKMARAWLNRELSSA